MGAPGIWKAAPGMLWLLPHLGAWRIWETLEKAPKFFPFLSLSDPGASEL